MFPDRVSVKNFTTDHNNVRTEIDAYESEAYIEEYSREVRNFDGTPVLSDFIILLPPKRKISAGSTVEILKIRGELPEGNEAIVHRVKSANRPGGHRASHLEVVV